MIMRLLGFIKNVFICALKLNPFMLYKQKYEEQIINVINLDAFVTGSGLTRAWQNDLHYLSEICKYSNETSFVMGTKMVS